MFFREKIMQAGLRRDDPAQSGDRRTRRRTPDECGAGRTEDAMIFREEIVTVGLRWDDHAKLPASFFHLTALHTLVLTDASALEAPDLANLTSLTTLLIASLKLTCEQLSSLVYLRSLTSISISQVTQVDHSAALPIAQLSKLKSLEFAGCCPDLFPSGEPSSSVERLLISQFKDVDLPDDIAQLLPRLRELSIRECDRFSELPEDFTSLSNLETLIISTCEYFRSLPENFGQLPVLKTLVLDGLHIHLSVLLNLRRLTLKLEGTGQGAAGTTTISSSSSSSSISSSPHLKHLENVEYLDLSIGEAVERFPFPRFPFPQLRFLKISFAKLIQKLPSDLGCDLRQLRQLRLHITKGLIELPETITLLRHLTSLDVEWASQLASLPDGMGALSRLRRLRLCHCSVLQHLPASLTRLSCFHELNAEETCIRALPPGIAQLTRLRCLNLGECKQLQVLPEGLTDLKMLRFLGVKGSETAIDSVSKEQERGFNRMYDLRTDVAGE
ncbi:unnamed protein product [Closterium sp. Naga37s-1]|nr:unnamed protein product [Closterium sp. Naga37s-1]